MLDVDAVAAPDHPVCLGEDFVANLRERLLDHRVVKGADELHIAQVHQIVAHRLHTLRKIT